MNVAPQLLLVGAVAAVGVLHTIVPDHWVPITLVARQRGWTKREVFRAALVAGTGHTVSTLLIGVLVWAAGVAFATRFGNALSSISSVALIAFGAWIALSSLRELRERGGRDHEHGLPHGLDHDGDFHGRVEVHNADATHEHEAHHGLDTFQNHDHELAITTPGQLYRDRGDAPEVVVAVNAPRRSGNALLEHVHPHRHGPSTVHVHRHQHDHDTWHDEDAFDLADPPIHDHDHKRSLRTTLLLILGSSPMVEGLPAFFAAGKYGAGLTAIMALVFAVATIATYVVLCLGSAASLQRVRLGPFERYGEVLSGGFIAAVGLVFLIFPVF